MDSVFSSMKWAAAVLQTTHRGGGDLHKVIQHHKEVADSWSKLAHAKLEASKSFAAWGKAEGDAVTQFFEHQCEIDSMFINLIGDIVKRNKRTTKSYKVIQREERVLENLRKKKMEGEAEISRIRKQVECSKKGKQNTLEVELDKAKASLEHTNYELDKNTKNVKKLKWRMLSESYKDQAASQAKFHDDAKQVVQAQSQLYQIYLQDAIPQLWNDRQLNTAAVEARTVINNLTETLNKSSLTFLQSQISSKSYSSSDSECADSNSDGASTPYNTIRRGTSTPCNTISRGAGIQDVPDTSSRPLPPLPGPVPNPEDTAEAMNKYETLSRLTRARLHSHSQPDQCVDVYDQMEKLSKEAAEDAAGCDTEIQADLKVLLEAGSAPEDSPAAPEECSPVVIDDKKQEETQVISPCQSSSDDESDNDELDDEHHH